MTRATRIVTEYSTLHITVAPRADGSYAVSAVTKRWKNGAKDQGHIVHRGTVTPEGRPGGTDADLWLVGVYFQQLAARGIVTHLGKGPTEEVPRGPLGGDRGGSRTSGNSGRHAEQPPGE